VQPPAQRSREVRVDYLGQQSFRITSSFGQKIITNPFQGGFPGNQRPDVVLITTERSDCNNVDAFDNSPTVFRGAVGIGSNNAAGTRIRGVPTYNDPEKESPDSMNLVYVWTYDGLRFCFLGHVQGQLTSSQVLQIGPVDVLFLPAMKDSGTIVSQLRPRVVIPMGGGASSLANSFSRVYRLPGSSVLFTRETMPADQTALVFGGAER
jgi:L-ascorbate metabolism protein UlaG (beta-lactamase superfamily)